MNLSLLTLGAVFLLIAARRVGRLRVAIWQGMTGGALLVLLTGEISPVDALNAIDTEVMLFLFGMFTLGQALVASGYLYALAYPLFNPIRSASTLLWTVLLGAGFGSALLMNDTLAIIGTPLVLRLAREHRLDESLLLLALAFSVTLGSVLSPIGNPQNLLIASQTGMAEPFHAFLFHLGPPTLLNLALAYGWLRWIFRASFHDSPLQHQKVTVLDVALARWAKLGLGLVVGLVLLRVSLTLCGAHPFPLSWIALAGASPVLLFSAQRGQILRQLDWQTLAFFAALFVLMESVWNSGFFQGLLEDFPLNVQALPTVLALGAGVSQLISNVPFVALYLPLLQQASANETAYLALAAGSTLAGNLLIMGAASNVIIIQHAEKHQASLSFFLFAKVGFPLTLLNLLVYWVWLGWFDQ